MTLARTLATLTVAAVAAVGGIVATDAGIVPGTHPATATAAVSAPVAPAPTPPAGPQPSACSEPLATPPGHAPNTAPVNVPEGGGTVNLNTASVAQLIALPGIGQIYSARIVAARPFTSVADMHAKVKGVPSKVDSRVTV